MTWLKLPNAGDTHTAVIKQCGEHAGRFGPQVKFQTTDDDDIYTPKDITLQQLGALGFNTFDDVQGVALRFSRVAAPDGGRPHWLIQPSATSPLATHTNGVRHMDTGSTEKEHQREAIRTRYQEALAHSLAMQREIFKGRGNPKVTAESVQAGAATLLIQYERTRCL